MSRDVPPGPVGVRELRQRASELLARVEAGATVTITRHGRPVALLVPSTRPDDPLESLVAEGRVLRAEDPGDLLGVVAADPSGGDLPGAALARLREEERW